MTVALRWLLAGLLALVALGVQAGGPRVVCAGSNAPIKFPGTGTVNWDEVFRALVDANFKGPLAIESFAAINDDLIAATCLWRPPNRPPDVLAAEGLRFMREKSAEYGLA